MGPGTPADRQRCNDNTRARGSKIMGLHDQTISVLPKHNRRGPGSAGQRRATTNVMNSCYSTAVAYHRITYDKLQSKYRETQEVDQDNATPG